MINITNVKYCKHLKTKNSLYPYFLKIYTYYMICEEENKINPVIIESMVRNLLSIEKNRLINIGAS